MLSRNKILLTLLVFFTIFLIIVYNLMISLTKIENKIETRSNIFETNILNILKSLPEIYFKKHTYLVKEGEVIFTNFVKNLNNTVDCEKINVWNILNEQIQKTGNFYPDNKILGCAINLMKYSKVVKADIDSRGTQLKLLLTFEGNQTVVFKPQWYDKNKVIEGPVYAGKDRYSSEILAFYLSGILNKHLVPISTFRSFNVSNLLLISSKSLLSTTFQRGSTTCIYGKCFYCKKKDPICENILRGVIIFNIPAIFKNHRSPWQRTYKLNKKAPWEVNENYCSFLSDRLSTSWLYDLIDTAIFDFLIQNGDRHHYDVFRNKVVWIDNGKGLGNPFKHHLDILAPLYQCCRIRNSTLNRLKELSGGVLEESLKLFSEINEHVSKEHIKAIGQRLLIVYATFEYCKNKS